MPRPKKWRKVCCLPKNNLFGPISKVCNKDDFIVMTVDEYEAIRLIDHEGFNQEECSKYMNVARTTVQMIYNDARKKISISLVEGKLLQIEGGEFRLCEGNERYCGCGGCNKHRRVYNSDK